METTEKNVGDQILFWLKVLGGSTVCMFLVLAYLTGTTYVSLCGLKADQKERVRTTTTFLREHPNGIPGITTATLRQSRNNAQKTVDTLKLFPFC